MHATISREELKKAIALKGAEAQKEFSRVVIFYQDECYSKVPSLKDEGLKATTSALQSLYMDFVEGYHQSIAMMPVVRFYMSRKKLVAIRDRWDKFIASIGPWEDILREHASARREQLLRETAISSVGRIKSLNSRINEIVSARITEIRAEEPNTLSSLALIPASKKLFELLTAGEDFEELEKNVKTLKDLECRARTMYESLVTRYA